MGDSVILSEPCGTFSDEELMKHFIYNQRYVNENTQSISRYTNVNELDEKYRSKSDNPNFNMPCYKVPRDSVIINMNDPSPDVIRDFFFNPSEGTESSGRTEKIGVKFCIHPQFNEDDKFSQLFQFEKLLPESVVPTSSDRTVVVEGKNYAVKLHVPIYISRYKRGVGEKTALHYLTCSKTLSLINISRFAHLRETLSVVFPRKEKCRSWGFVVRELRPFPYEAKRKLTPCFALHGNDKNKPDKCPKLVKLIKVSGIDAEEFLLKFFYMIIAAWIQAFLEQGLLLEFHSQNTLIETNEKDELIRVVLQDMDLQIHAGIRTELGLSLDGFTSYQIINDEGHEKRPHGSALSMSYDTKMGEMLFRRLVRVAEKHCNVNTSSIEEKCRKFFVEKFPNYKTYMPPHRYVLDDQDGLHPKDGWVYKQNGKPVWRPID